MTLKSSPLVITPKDFYKKINAPTSKSYANRALIVAALSKEAITIKGIPPAADVFNLINCFKKIGLEIKESSDSITISNSFPACEKDISTPIELSTGDGGTTNRFLIPFLTLGKREYKIVAAPGIMKRPNEELFNHFSSYLDLKREDCWMSIKGPCSFVDDIEVDCSISTQFYSAIKMLEKNIGVNVKPINVETSKGYIEITHQVLDSLSNEYQVPIDFSSCSYLLALGASLGEVEILNFSGVDKLQGDSILVDVLKEMGAIVKDKATLKVKKEILKGFALDCSQCPDLVPTLAFLAAISKGESELQNIKVLRHKESDRILEIQKILDFYKIDNSYEEETDLLTIVGKPEKQENYFKYTSPEDHRMAMTASLFMRYHGGGEIKNHECVRKSFANFFELIE